MSKKIVLCAFQGEMMCFAHVLLNGLNMHEKGYDVKIVIEGSSTKLIKEFHDKKEKAMFFVKYQEVKSKKLIDAVCKACATKMGSIQEVEKEGLPIVGDIDGDGDVDIEDFALFALYWQQTDCGECEGADLTGEGNVGLDDLLQLVDNWMEGTD